MNTPEQIKYYYERNKFIIDPNTFVDMVCLTCDKISIEDGYKKTTYSTLESYSEELSLNEIPNAKRKELEQKTRLEINLELTKEEYLKFSKLEGKELYDIDPTNIKSNI
ncbi:MULTISPECIES: hypothetical protein [Oceanobacillus]|uniref:Uncharacterized protein n=1 Tax=Oceanobacillus kimchii TaxID=746691 RepID=A0ABQ5TQS3_9BACI|nr:hypothetical protein [Oceanobacillus kimchii]GLO68264.1 hypothetical protein MACH08_40480 [Oceanobacillus kimchii]